MFLRHLRLVTFCRFNAADGSQDSTSTGWESTRPQRCQPWYCHSCCLKSNTGYSTILYSAGSCTLTQRSGAMTVLTCIGTCTAVLSSTCFLPVCIAVSRLSLQLCLPAFVPWSFHPIETVGITAKRKKSIRYGLGSGSG